MLKREYGIEVIDQRMNLQLSRASVKETQYLGISADDVVFVGVCGSDIKGTID